MTQPNCLYPDARYACSSQIVTATSNPTKKKWLCGYTYISHDSAKIYITTPVASQRIADRDGTPNHLTWAGPGSGKTVSNNTNNMGTVKIICRSVMSGR